MTLEEIKSFDNSFWLNFLKEKSMFDTVQIKAMIQYLIEKAETNEADKIELERLARIGRAAEEAFDYFSMGTVDENDKEYFVFLTVEDMLEWAEKED